MNPNKYQTLINYVDYHGIEHTISLLPDRLNLRELIKIFNAPKDADLTIHKYNTSHHTMYFVGYDSKFGQSSTIYLQTNGISLPRTLVDMLVKLIEFNILDFKSFI